MNSFNYDASDLDLDSICQNLVAADLERLKSHLPASPDHSDAWWKTDVPDGHLVDV